ncbi:hypothetical protein F383_05739 [Gossypium arboreum]|uniref:Uncharacterized protein n=1 Tax=Gossypium arboreum TaxID=29729 RepID=A0A0B0MHK4_GOSAR|nr:hypothetical protein F383_05739 [Gossypium arboreum]
MGKSIAFINWHSVAHTITRIQHNTYLLYDHWHKVKELPE